ncbi:Type I restriction-modification system, specificity subunit S [Vibrio cholerae]|nr:Type I restriction-modification system, specificity subunit S [Vibrio cholerae]
MERLALMPKYEVYKNSGEDWIGDIPSGWDLMPIRSIFKFRNEKNSPVKTEEILSLSIANGVTKYSDEGRGGNKRKDDISAYKIAHPKDIVLNSMNVIVGAVGMSKYYGAISPVYYALYTESEDVLVEYYEKIFLNEGFQRGLLKFGKGILIKLSGTGKLNTIRMKVSTDDLKTLYFPKPPITEQNLIFAFLDKKNAQIDEAIAIKEQQISLLKERKQIIIQQAVTQGLDPNVPMKDSGVDWIGKIPEHWEMKRVKNIFRLVMQPSEKNNDYELLSVYTDIGVKPRRELEERGNKASTTDGYWFVKKGDIVVNKLLAWMGAIGLSEYEGVTSPAYDILRPKLQINGFFYHYLFRSDFCSAELKRHSRGIMDMRLRLYFDRFGVVEVPYPPVDEQNEIIHSLETEMKEMDKGIEHLNTQIEKLKEYKTTLINSAVTGKIKITPEMVEQ